MADKKISELVSLAGKDVAATDLFPVVDVNVAEVKSLTRDELRNAVNAIQFAATKALATTAAASLPDDTIIEVAADESLAGATTRYTVTAGALAFSYGVVTKADLADASDPAKGAALVGFSWTTLATDIDNADWGIQTAVTGGKNALIYVAPNEWPAILAGTSTTDHSAAIQAALADAESVFFPAGRWNITSAIISLKANQRIVGAGMGRTVFRHSYTAGTAGCFYANSGSASTASNLEGIYIADLTIDGQVDTLGYQAFTHLISLHGVTDVVIERVKLQGHRGDGIYLGSGISVGNERHNINVRISNCVIDGVVKNNRNGLSIIDCDGLLVDNCTFKRIGNSTLARSVGAIDIEPDNNFSVCRNITVRGGLIEDISSTNTAGFTYFNGRQTTSQNIGNIKIIGVTFRGCYWGFSCSTVSKTTESTNDDITVQNCKFINGTHRQMFVNGLKMVRVVNNEFTYEPSASAPATAGVVIGYANATACMNAIDITIRDNTFTGLKPQNGLIEMNGANGLKIIDNTFQDIQGRCIYFFQDVTSGPGRIITNMDVIGNHVTNRKSKTGSEITTNFISTAGGINTGNSNSFINAKNREYGNVVDSGVTLLGGGSLTIFNDSANAGAPTSGTWDIGSGTRLTAPSAGAVRQVCSIAGTFGTLASVTADATNGSASLLNVVDTAVALREGHYISVNGATTRKILAIVGTTIYLDGGFTGVTGTGLSVAWSAPTFVAV